MKILFISRMYPNSFNNRNGIVILKQAEELQKRGHEIIVISPTPFTPKIIKNFREEWSIYSKLKYKTLYKNIPVYRPRFIDLPIKSFKKYSWNSLKYFIIPKIDKLHELYRFDVIHAHMGYPEGRLAVYLKKRYNLPVVITYRSTDTVKNMLNKQTSKHLYFALSNADAVISPSIPLKRKVENAFNINSLVIGNGTYKNNRVQKNEELLNKYKNKTIILSVSTLIKRKGIENNIRAVSQLVTQLPDIIYLIIGDGPERNNLQSFVRNNKLEEYVRFIGDIPNREVMEYISICDVFSLPSWGETFGLVYIEAMLNRKPIILCKNEAIEGTVKHKQSGMIVEPNNVDQIADSIKFLCNNKRESNNIAENGEKIVLENFLWDRIAEKLEDVYLNVIK
ncbi:glycosyltransferase [Cerasibacillus sp. JNUCC 74]